MKSILVLSILLASHFATAQSMQPGLWQAKTNFELNGLPLPASEDEECITSAQAKDVKSTIAKELKKKGCELTKWSVKGQALAASLACKSESLEAKGELKGTVTAKSYDIGGEASGTFHKIPSTAKLKLTGKWLRTCK